MLLRRSKQCLIRPRSLKRLQAVSSNSPRAIYLPRDSPAHTRHLSTPSIPSVESSTINAFEPEIVAAPDASNSEDNDKPGGRRRKTKTPCDRETKSDNAALPLELADEIIWLPCLLDHANPPTLPSPALFQDALTKLMSTLHPQAQHRATYPSSSGPLVEPTLALYTPLQGSIYVIDYTVQELARQTKSDVLVIDALDLIAGECGRFGRAGSCIQFPRNPIQVAASEPFPSSPFGSGSREEEENDPPFFMRPMPANSSVTVEVPSNLSPFLSPSQSRSKFLVSSAPRPPTPSKVKAFFDELINLTHSEDSSPAPNRLIYVRNFEIIADSLPAWYPDLLASVRQRRQGPLARPSSAVANPTTIIFGIGPSILPPADFNHQRGDKPSLSRKPPKPPLWEESPEVENDREKRLKEQLKKWDRGNTDALLHEALGSQNNDIIGVQPIVVFANMASALIPRGRPMIENLSRPIESGGPDFYRVSVLVPQARIQSLEREQRTRFRRDINKLNMRMAIRAAGGIVGQEWDEPTGVATETTPIPEENPEQYDAALFMFLEWGLKVEPWPTIKAIADRALASAFTPKDASKHTALEPTSISWADIISAWDVIRATRSNRQASIRSFIQDGAVEEFEEDEDREREHRNEDEIVERVRQDPDLDTYEQRLLGCIINPATMPTTFDQVHLPDHTIDSVRTLVSLPLLHPSAFDHGILKQHAMTGALLFGPPGTGKTLCVRALARESGARMMLVKPSDVMDMYVGEGEKLVRSVFALARRLTPCVIFLDEIDALFGARVSGRETGGAIAHRGVITEFMQEMDGLKNDKSGSVIVIGATNRPFDLDDAVLRRLPRRLLVDLPGEKEREAILHILLKDEILAPNVDLAALAKRTESFSGSDLKHLCVAAALDAVKEFAPVPWRRIPTLPAPALDTDVPTVDALGLQKELLQSDAQLAPIEVSQIEKTIIEPHHAAISTMPTPHAIQPLPPRVLSYHHFQKALMEISPSASESLGTLADLRKWNEEFGEGGRKKRGKRIWGSKFGFWKGGDVLEGEEGRVVKTISTAEKQDIPLP